MSNNVGEPFVIKLRRREGFIHTLTSTIGLLALVNPDQDEVLSRYDALRARCTEQCDLIQAAEELGLTLDPPIIAIVLIQLVRRDWYRSGAEQVIYLKDWLDFSHWGEGSEDGRFVLKVASVLVALAHIELGHEFDERRLIEESVESIVFAAAVAEGRHHGSNALEALDAARVLSLEADLPLQVHVRLAAEALRVARGLDDPDRAVLQALQYANALGFAAERGHASWVEALDAFESVLRNLPKGKDALKLCVDVITEAAGKEELSALQPWLYMITANPPPYLEKLVSGCSGYLPLVFAGDLQAFLAKRSDLCKVVQLAEDVRLMRQDKASDHMAQADWATWSLRHAAFRNAISHGNSFMRERDRHGLMLVLNHEVTHILCMSSGVGIAIIALRDALVELEAQRADWTTTDPETFLDALRSGLPPITGNNPLELAPVERALEITLKLRVLEDCWAPWLEGIAIVEELSDPRDDPEAHVPSLQVLMGLVDAQWNLEGIAPKEAIQVIETKIQDYFTQFERLYGDALEAQGVARLRAYLTPPYSHKYLAGFITVRSILAEWRNTLGRPLTSSVAGRLLIHMMRYGTHDVVPDLALPLDEFRQQTIRRHLDWVAWLARLPGDQLQEAENLVTLDSSFRPARWRNGRLEPVEVDEQALQAEVDAQLVKLAGQARASLTGQYGSFDRVPGADAECLAAIEVAEQASEREHRLDEKTVIGLGHYHIQLLRVLPLGEVDAPFWLLSQEAGFFVLIRTTEKHYEHGGPSYNGMTITGLERAEFERLQSEVRRIQRTRMTVRRFADVVPGGVVEGRGFGRNVLVFQYGEWTHMQACGLLFGVPQIKDSLRADIEMRMESSPVAQFNRFLADGPSCARRVRTWLEKVAEWRIGEEVCPIQPWVSHVLALAEEIENPSQRSEYLTVSAALLRFALGLNAPAETALEEGLLALRTDDEGSVTSACRLLFATARGPLEDDWARAEAQHWTPLFELRNTAVDLAAPVGPIA